MRKPPRKAGVGSLDEGEIDQPGGAIFHFISSSDPDRNRAPEIGRWHATVQMCLSHPSALRLWESSFLRDLPGFERIYIKQRYVLKAISDRVLGGAA
jgi:hypothetical protein